MANPFALTVDLIQSTTLTRDKLAEWHHRFRSKLFPLVSGLYVRCRQEDTREGKSAYKVARIKNVRTDWSIELDILNEEDAQHHSTKAAGPMTNYDCVSNSKITDQEFQEFVTRLTLPQTTVVIDAIRMLERMSFIENVLVKDPDFAGKKKEKPAVEAEKPAGARQPLQEVESKLTFSTNVLLLNEDGTYDATVTMSDLLRRAIGVAGNADADTPRAKALTAVSPFAFREPEDKMASDTTMVLLSDLEKHIASPTVPMQQPWKLSRLILEAGRATQFTSFDYGADLATFAAMTLAVLNLTKDALAKEPLYHSVESPVYVFGDIHGNFVDLQFFLSGLITFDDFMMKYSGHSLLFLGDYVDRGSCSLECVLYLFILKLINPKKIYLLRGNHESPEVNGDLECYGYSSFKYQCIDRFGRDKGMEVWTACNEVFAFLPLCAAIDNKIFCVHGGLPQFAGGEDRRLDILKDPNFPRFPQVQCDVQDNRELRLMVNDLLWSDPASRGCKLNDHGFGPNPRGPDIHSFGSKAVDEFCSHFGFQFIFRAHQEKADGLRLSDNARVVTIFSTSDYAGHQNGAGVIYVNKKKIRLVIKKPKIPGKPGDKAKPTVVLGQPRPPSPKASPPSPGKSPSMIPFFR